MPVDRETRIHGIPGLSPGLLPGFCGLETVHERTC